MPVFNLIADDTDAPKVEFMNYQDASNSPWNFSDKNDTPGIFNFVTNGKSTNKNGTFVFNGLSGIKKSFLINLGYLAIDGNPVFGQSEAIKYFNFKDIVINGTSNGLIVSLK